MRSKIFSGLTLAAVLMGAVACSNYTDPSLNAKKGLLVKAPEFYAYSGGSELGNGALTSRKANNANGNMWYQTWDTPTNITEEERAKVVEEFSKVRENYVNDVCIDWENFYLQQVHKGETTYTNAYGGDAGRGSDKMNHLLVWNENNGDYEHNYNFNSGNNTTVYTEDGNSDNNPNGQYIGTSLMVDMSVGDHCENQFGYHNSNDSKNHFEYIILEIDGYYYIGFDFYSHGSYVDQWNNLQNGNMDVERDWIFNDWIIKVTPAYPRGTTPEDNPGGIKNPTDPTEPEEPTVDPTDPETPDFGINPDCDEVEINFSINAEKTQDDYIATKLSIHLRAATDVEVFIPVPVQYYIDQDDTYIVEKHEENLYVYLGDQVQSFEIAGQIVTVTVKYEPEGIRVTTDGMNETVLDYLAELFGDGLTIEVWNYFNSEIGTKWDEEGKAIETAPVTRAGLQTNYFNHSTVEFLDQEPCQYVNAFMYETYYNEETGEFLGSDPSTVLDLDCVVNIIESQAGDYNDPQQGLHYNGSIHNQIYTHVGE